MRAPTSRWLRYGVIANLVVLAVLIGGVLSQAYPSSEAVRLRNALLMEVGSPSDFDWTPDSAPHDFLVSQRDPYPEFTDAAEQITSPHAGDWQKALALAARLTQNAKDTGAIQADLLATYRSIVDEGSGYCADYTDVYLGLAHAAGLGVRNWAFSFDGFGGHGHSFIEVFDRQRGRWVFLDVYNNFHVVDRTSGEALSALEFRQHLLGRGTPVRSVPNGPGRMGYVVEEKLFDYYRRGADEWYLWWGNAVFSYDAHPLVHLAGKLARPMEQLAAIAANVHPHFRVLATPENLGQVERMMRLRSKMQAVFVVAAGLLLLLIVQIVLLVRRNLISSPATCPPKTEAVQRSG